MHTACMTLLPLPNYVVCTRLANFPLILQLFLKENMSVGLTYVLKSFQDEISVYQESVAGSVIQATGKVEFEDCL